MEAGTSPPKDGDGVVAGDQPEVQSGAVAAPSPPQVRRVRPPAEILETDRRRQEARESKHWDACGKQVNSRRKTNPVAFFASPRVVQNKDRNPPRCRELSEHPARANPGPETCVRPSQTPRSNVLKGWGCERRFMDDPSPFLLEGSAPPPPAASKTGTEEPLDPAAGGAATSSTATAPEPLPVSPKAPPAVDRHHSLFPEPLPDLNVLRIRYKGRPSWSFGSSGIGYRFEPGRKFSKQVPCSTTTRLKDFRELRDMMPPISPSKGPTQ